MQIGFLDYEMVDRSRPGVSGVSDMVWDLARGLVEWGDGVHVVGPYTSDESPVVGAWVHRYHVPAAWYRNAISRMLIVERGAAILKRIGGLDLVHVPEYVSGAQLTYRLPQLPVVLTTPGNIFERIDRFNPYDAMTTAVY
jgi:hypothetical protein